MTTQLSFGLAKCLSAWLFLVFVLGCDSSSSPTDPAGGGGAMVATVVFENPSALVAHQDTIRSLLEDTALQANGRIPVGRVQFVVRVDPSRTIPGWGLGGYTLSGNDIEIVVDDGGSDLAQLLPARLPQIAAHEIHHAVRWRGPGPYSTLLEALVFEGLADQFSLELLAGAPPPWVQAFPEQQTMTYIERARPEFDQFFDFEAWFFGIGTDLPRWTGYTLGYRLVGDYVAANPGSSAASLVQTPAEAFRP